MKVTSAILTTMSGKLGGAVASTARGGVQYFRKLVTPRNPRTELQTGIRSAISSVASAWRSILDQAQRDAWWDLVSGGETGGTLFARVNNARQYDNNSGRHVTMDATAVADAIIIEDPPTSLSLVFNGATIIVDDSSNNLQLTAIDQEWQNLTDEDIAATNPSILYVYATHQQSPSRNSRQNPYELVAALHWNGGTTPVYAKNVDLAALGITTTAGQVVYVKLIAQNSDGATSIPLEYRRTIVA